MDEHDIRFEPVGERGAVEFLHARITEFNLGTTGLPAADPILAVVRDDVGAIVAGIYGWVWGGAAEVDLLWVDEARRGTGIGRALLAAFEREASDRGATQIVLDTADFQAPEFYARLGYEPVGRVVDYPRGSAITRMRKPLAPPA